MVSQIIISHEDSTSFFSIGSVQDDASLVSALGGALSSFAIEMGLSESQASQANYSKFQNGILISKWLDLGDFSPSLMIAVRGFKDLEQYQQVFLVDYGTAIAKKVITTYEKLYAGNGEIPRFDDAIKLIPSVANALYKDSPNTLKEFTIKLDKQCESLLTDMWENQDDKGLHPFKFRDEEYSYSKLDQYIDDFSEHFYKEGAAQDALFPLKFAVAPDMSLVRKYIEEFLKRKATESELEIKKDIYNTLKQLQNVSFSGSRRDKKALESVKFINANLIFEQITVAKLENIEKVRTKVLDNLLKNLMEKMYQKYPLKFISAGLNKQIDINFIRECFITSVKPLLTAHLENTSRFIKQTSTILRDITAKLTPEKAIEKSSEIIPRVETEFLQFIIKRDPFIILADEKIRQITVLAKTLVKESFQQYRTAHDEAMALWYIVREINQSIEKLKSTTLTNQMRVLLVQELIRKYQFRSVPDIVYNLTKIIFSDVTSSSSSKRPVELLFKRNLKSFEESAGIIIPKEITKSIFARIRSVKSSQSFENIEELSYYSKAFSSALESTILAILELYFGTKQYPQPPRLLTNSMKEIIANSQYIYSICNVFNELHHQPGAKDLFTYETNKLFSETLKFNGFIPDPIELVRYGIKNDFILNKVSSRRSAKNKKELLNLSKTKFLKEEVTISSLNRTTSISKLIKDPEIISTLLLKYLPNALQNRLQKLNKHIKTIEDKLKITPSNDKKKSYSSKIKQLKSISKAITQIFSGGNFIQKLFLAKKDLGKLLQSAFKKKYPKLDFYSEKIMKIEKGKNLGEKMYVHYDKAFGTYDRVLEVFTSTWVRDSEYINHLKEDIIWGIIKKDTKNILLNRKIIRNLKDEADNTRNFDLESIVRNTIEQEVTLIFNKAVRDSIEKIFSALKEDIIVIREKKSKDYYFIIESLTIPEIFVKPFFDAMPLAKCKKVSNEKLNIGLNLTELLPAITSRKKKSQSIRAHLRDGLRENLRTYYMKTLASLGELIDSYIGEQATDLFYTKSRFLEQLILESLDPN